MAAYTDFEIDFKSNEVLKEINKLARKAKNIGSVNQQLAHIIDAMVEDKFENEGPGWPKLSDITIKNRRESAVVMMLQDSGIMKGSIAVDYGPDYAGVFTNNQYARYHLEGEGVPKRDFFDIDLDKALDTMQEILLLEIGGKR